MTRHHRAIIVLLSGCFAALQHGHLAKGQICVTTTPPADATVLINGKDCSNWIRRNRQPAEWKVEDGVLVAREYDIRTRQVFGDHQLHIEFLVPPKPKADESGNGNSGAYVHGFYEIQIIENESKKPHKSESCGAIYGQAAPAYDASLPTGQWQSYDVLFQAPRFNSNGKQTARARMTVLHNGVLIHRDAEIDITPGCLPDDQFNARGPLLLQHHGYPVRFRNIWIRRLPQAIDGPREMSIILPGGTRMTMIRIPAGTFVMGTPEKEFAREPDESQHQVTLTQDYWMGKFEVTNAQYRRFRPDHVSRRKADGPCNGDDYPVTDVTWHDATAFCKWASERTGWAIRLPTETEWEYASRAGTSTTWSFGDDINELKKYAWYKQNTGGDGHKSAPVGQLLPNPWGLYDMHGNAAEWCADWYGRYQGVPMIDPQGATSGKLRVSREGSHGSDPGNTRPGDRDKLEPEFKCDALGLRVVFGE